MVTPSITSTTHVCSPVTHVSAPVSRKSLHPECNSSLVRYSHGKLLSCVLTFAILYWTRERGSQLLLLKEWPFQEFPTSPLSAVRLPLELVLALVGGCGRDSYRGCGRCRVIMIWQLIYVYTIMGVVIVGWIWIRYMWCTIIWIHLIIWPVVILVHIYTI